jgi:hypothetical protein
MLSPVTSSPYSWVGKYKSATIKIGPLNIVYHNYQKNSPSCEIGIWNVSTTEKTLRYDPNMCGLQSICSKLPIDFTSDIGTDLVYLNNWSSSNPNAFGYQHTYSGRMHYYYTNNSHSHWKYCSEMWMSPSRCQGYGSISYYSYERPGCGDTYTIVSLRFDNFHLLIRGPSPQSS